MADKKKISEDLIDVEKLVALEDELQARKEEQGIVEEEKGIKRAISNFFDRSAIKTTVSKKKYLLLACFLGIFGAHRFYSKKWTTAVIYLLTCWCGYSFAMTLVDLIIVLPMKADENGNIEI